jgi:hypothetical protein
MLGLQPRASRIKSTLVFTGPKAGCYLLEADGERLTESRCRTEKGRFGEIRLV